VPAKARDPTKERSMTVQDTIPSPQIASTNEYFRRIDAGDFAAELFTSDFEFFFPKYGVGRGPAAFLKLVAGLMTAVQRLTHHPEEFVLVEAGKTVVIEGTTEGSGVNGVDWRGGSTPGGRFCSVFVFDSRGLIERMYIYLDPDYTSADTSRFLWPAEKRQGW
jgi:hypothetical protein